MGNCVAHPSHLSVPSLTQHDLQDRLTAITASDEAEELDARRQRAPPVDRHATPQPFEIALVGHTLDERLIRALELVPRMRDLLGKAAVVRQDNEAFGIVVESAD